MIGTYTSCKHFNCSILNMPYPTVVKIRTTLHVSYPAIFFIKKHVLFNASKAVIPTVQFYMYKTG